MLRLLKFLKHDVNPSIFLLDYWKSFIVYNDSCRSIDIDLQLPNNIYNSIW